MKAELKQKWIEALRSGKYKQGRGHFERGGRFCCLGVLCKVSGEPATDDATKIGNWWFVEAVLPQLLDLKLAGMNDGGMTFPEIADWIEANIPAE